MTEKDKKPLEQETESILDFEDAKDMTIGQANRKAEEIEAGVTEDDNVLDKYIKQHRAEIEADKYDTKILAQEELAKAEELAAKEAATEVVEAPTAQIPKAGNGCHFNRASNQDKVWSCFDRTNH